MKNLTKQWAARALAMKDLHARHAIWASLNGYTESLLQRLRKGLASREEIAFAADLIEGKVKPRRLRRGQPSLIANDQIAQAVFQFQVVYSGFQGWPENEIKKKVAEMFGVTPRHVYNVLEALDPADRKRHERNARYAVSAYIGNATELAAFMGHGKIARK